MATIVLPRRALVAGLAVLLAAAGAAIAYVRLPHATITVLPASHERPVTQEITLSSSATAPDFIRFILPAKVVETEVTETKTFTREGTKVTEDFARGKVKLFNKQADEQRLLPKSHLRHEATGIFFLTDSPAVIPPQGEFEIGVTAKEQGKVGNVAAGKFIIDKLPTSVQAVVYGESSTPMSGGTRVESPLSEDELNKAKEEVAAHARERARTQLSTAAGGVGIRDDLVTVETEVSASVEPGSQATEFTVVNKTKARAFVVDENDILSLTLLALRSSPSADEEFVSYSPDSFKLAIVRSDITRGEARVRGSLTGSFASKTGPTLFSADNLAGRGEKEVQEYFKQFPSVGSVEVKFSPFWVTTVPSRPDATEIVVKSGQN